MTSAPVFLELGFGAEVIFCGLHITTCKCGGLFLHQLKICRKGQFRPTTTPETKDDNPHSTQRRFKTEFDQLFPNAVEVYARSSDPKLMRAAQMLCGYLQWLVSHTRPDLAYCG